VEESKQLLLEEALYLWNSFKDEILYKNRFIVNHPVLDYVKIIAEKNKESIENNTTYYRARVFKDDSYFTSYLGCDFDLNGFDVLEKYTTQYKRVQIELKGKSKFWGYDEDNSFVPKNNSLISEGRFNPSLIKYLYASQSPYTALTEVRPFLGSSVSVAEIKLTEEITIADFSYHGVGVDNSLEEMLKLFIMDNFSKPINTNIHDYIPTQYIAEYLKKLGYDGIKFNSSLHQGGSNFTIFNYYKCKAVSSKLYKIKDICLGSDCIAPLNEQGLIHSKIKPYKYDPIPKSITRLRPENKDS